MSIERLVGIEETVMDVEPEDSDLHSSFVNYWLISWGLSFLIGKNGGNIDPTCRAAGKFKSHNNKSYYLLNAYYVLSTAQSYR